MELLLSGLGQVRVLNIMTFASPNFIIPICLIIASVWFLAFGAKSYSLLYPRVPVVQLPGHASSYILAGFSRFFRTMRNANQFPVSGGPIRVFF